MNKLIPDFVFHTIYEITPDFLHENQIQAILLDLDDTIVPHNAPTPPERFLHHMAWLRDAEIQVIVFSNNNERRVKNFCTLAELPYIWPVRKPLKSGYAKAEKMLGLPMSRVAVVGDQIFTDVLGGHRAGALACYVRPFNRNTPLTRLLRFLEKRFVRRGQKMMEDRRK